MQEPTAGLTTSDYRERNTELFNARRAVLDNLVLLIGGFDKDRPAPSVVLRAAADPDRVAHLTSEDERDELARLVRSVERFTEDIVVANFGLVRDYVSRFTRGNRDGFDDFEGAGMVGLMQAIDSFDPAMGTFGQWAFRPIKRAVLRAVRDHDHPNLSSGDFERRPDILRAKLDLSEDGYEPTEAEIAGRAGATLEQTKRVLAPPALTSLSTPIGAGDGSTVEDTLADPALMEDAVMSQVALESLERYGLPVLTAREMFVMCRRFGIDGEPEAKLSAIGAVLGLSREAVRNVEAKALSKLGHPATLRAMLRNGRP